MCKTKPTCVSFYMLTKFFTALIFRRYPEKRTYYVKLAVQRTSEPLHSYTCHGHLADTFSSEDDGGNVISVRWNTSSLKCSFPCSSCSVIDSPHTWYMLTSGSSDVKKYLSFNLVTKLELQISNS